MVQNNKTTDSDLTVATDTTDTNQSATKTAKPESNLVKMQDSSKENQVLEINKQMSSLESSITTLNKQLNTTNKQIKSDVKRLTESDAEITDKVAETYRQLGQIDVTFKDLGEQSKAINKNIKSINNKITKIEKASAKSLSDAIENQTAVNDEFRSQHQDLIKRAEDLAKKSTTLTSKLNKSIKDNSTALTELEAKIVTELETLAAASEHRDDRLDGKIKDTNKEVSSQKASMLLMQSVDEALEKRAAALEATTENLLADTAELNQSTETLNILTAKLGDDIEALEIHTAQLAEQNQQQQGFIEQLQDKTESLGRALLALATLEKKHFRILGATSIVLLLAIAAVFFYQQYQADIQQAQIAQRTDTVDQELFNLKNRVQDEQMASQVFYGDITDLQNNLQQLQQELKGVNQEVATINEQVVEMNDQVDSIDGRIQYLAPLHNIGSDNTIHGSEWLSKLDTSKHSIKVATVNEKQELYETASRYNHYLKQDLGYYINNDGSFTLIHGGQYSEDQLPQVLRDMPSYINYERVASISNADILKQLQQK